MTADSDVPAVGERLQKLLARTGFGSRRVCEDLIVAGRVARNGVVAELGNRVGPTDTVTVDGVPVPTAAGLVHLLLNKPRGVVSTASDPQGRPTVVELVPDEPRLHPVGRLDVDTEGLLILTNDGDLTHRLTHPSFGVEKEYLAEVTGVPGPAVLRTLRTGVNLDDGITAPARVTLVQSDIDSGRAAVSLVIHEGRNRQVRRMLDAVGHPVRRLARVRIGPIADRSLTPGSSRALTAGEVRALYEASRSDPEAGAGAGAEPPGGGEPPRLT